MERPDIEQGDEGYLAAEAQVDIPERCHHEVHHPDGGKGQAAVLPG